MSYQIAFRLWTLLDEVQGQEGAEMAASTLRETITDLQEHGLIPRGQRWRTADGEHWFGPPEDATGTIMIHMPSGCARRRRYLEEDCGPLELLDPKPVEAPGAVR